MGVVRFKVVGGSDGRQEHLFPFGSLRLNHGPVSDWMRRRATLRMVTNGTNGTQMGEIYRINRTSIKKGLDGYRRLVPGRGVLYDLVHDLAEWMGSQVVAP